MDQTSLDSRNERHRSPLRLRRMQRFCPYLKHARTRSIRIALIAQFEHLPNTPRRECDIFFSLYIRSTPHYRPPEEAKVIASKRAGVFCFQPYHPHCSLFDTTIIAVYFFFFGSRMHAPFDQSQKIPRVGRQDGCMLWVQTDSKFILSRLGHTAWAGQGLRRNHVSTWSTLLYPSPKSNSHIELHTLNI